jgi:hypothetical protein
MGQTMDTNYVFAGLVVKNRDHAAAWYERLLGRPPTFLPNDAEAVCRIGIRNKMAGRESSISELIQYVCASTGGAYIAERLR